MLSSLGPVRIKKLIQHFGAPEKAWKAKASELAEVEGFNKNVAEKVVMEREQVDYEKAWDKISKMGYSCITWEDPTYPSLLKEIYAPPPVLYFCGDIGVLNETTCVAMVGSRRHTVYGRDVAYKFAYKLSSYGLIVVSGMARGIDTWAHKGALDAGGKTAAVLGCGLDICYPPENKAVMQKIQEQGLVLSEFAPGSRPLPQNFPRRNRIISGLCQGTIVVEAGEKSGALITADFALEQGREVFAVPGGIASPYSRGCHKLIKEGAKLVEKVEDILESLPLCSFNSTTQERETRREVKQEFNADEKKLLALIPYEPLALEDIAALSEMPLPLVNALLLELELKGAVKQLPGKYFAKN